MRGTGTWWVLHCLGLSHQLQGEDSAACDKPVPLLQISEAAVSQDLLDRLCRAPQLGIEPTWCSAPGQEAAISSHWRTRCSAADCRGANAFGTTGCRLPITPSTGYSVGAITVCSDIGLACAWAVMNINWPPPPHRAGRAVSPWQSKQR